MYDDKGAFLLVSISFILKEAQCNLAIRSTKEIFSHFQSNIILGCRLNDPQHDHYHISSSLSSSSYRVCNESQLFSQVAERPDRCQLKLVPTMTEMGLGDRTDFLYWQVFPCLLLVLLIPLRKFCFICVECLVLSI